MDGLPCGGGVAVARGRVVAVAAAPPRRMRSGLMMRRFDVAATTAQSASSRILESYASSDASKNRKQRESAGDAEIEVRLLLQVQEELRLGRI